MKRYAFVWRSLAVLALWVGADATQAAVVPPALDTAVLAGDTGVSNVGSALTFDGTTYQLALDTTATNVIDIADVDFRLTATYNHQAGASYFFDNGTLTIGTLLTATFSNLAVQNLGRGIGKFSADLIYTGGTLAGTLTTGLLTGRFDSATATATGLMASDYSANFTASNFNAVVGTVNLPGAPLTAVPVPNSVWLMLSAVAAGWTIARRQRPVVC